MAEKERQQNKKRGIVTDTSFLNQPPGTLPFALNTVNESSKGDKGNRVNEESNEACYQLPDGYIPIGEIFITNDSTVIFSVTENNSSSEIGIVNGSCDYTTLVRTSDLGFKLENQISGTYRLRRGCERVIYFTTPTPMIYNIDKPEDFKNSSVWDAEKFKLFKVYDAIPTFENIEILENGSIKPGSYNASIQYLDEDLNPTEWITTSEVIKIYNDSNTKNYESIRGSTSVEDSITNFGITNKAIKFTFDNFDTSYPFYRVAIIEANTGSGLVTGVKYSEPISTDIPIYTYSGDNSTVENGTEEEILFFNNIIEKAEYITQIENRLILGQTQGSQVDFCELQKYASKVTADVVLKDITLNKIGGSNPKTEEVNFNGTGYMPGEIYSFGLVYIFEDSTTSPVFHIPGKNELYPSGMSNNNKLADGKYQSSSCKDYWGKDSEGMDLEGQFIRHHRFPLRSELGIPLYTKEDNTEIANQYTLSVNYSGTSSEVGKEILFGVEYTLGVLTPQNKEYDSSYTTPDPAAPIDNNNTVYIGTLIPIVTSITESTDGGVSWETIADGGTSASGITYQTSIQTREIVVGEDNYETQIMGIEFSNIELPPQTNGKKIIGYYVVRNERTEENKTILDTGVLTPMMLQDKGFVVHGHLFPELSSKEVIDKDIFGLIHPEHKFNSNEYRSASEVLIEGFFEKGNQSRSSVTTQDVGAGTSYNPDVHKKSSADYDGFSLHTLTRDTEVSFNNDSSVLMNPTRKGEIFYLDALNSKSVEDSDDVTQDVFNISGDNKIGIVKLENNHTDPTIVHDKLPYVVLKRTLGNPYLSFRSLPYYKESTNPVYFSDPSSDTTQIFNGDTYITPMKYHSAVFNDFRLARRDTKSGIWKIIIGALLIAGGTVAAALGGVQPGIAAVSYGISLLSSGIETSKIAKVYEELYEAGLRETLQDDDIKAVFDNSFDDDEMQWLGDSVSNLWFESSVNMGLRNGASVAITDFIDAPANLSIGGVFNGKDSSNEPARALDNYLIEKLTTIDTDNEDGRLYKGFAGAELYLLNDDYKRINKQKIYYALGIEYDCCSKCQEDFPQRVHFSQQAFQEELTDNYRVFLPNNYRDIEGEKGIITDVFRIQNNLYIHTEGALWHLPQNIQERITGDIVSFIGTGDFFSVPPRKITDADKESAGTKHNWGTMKTPNGTLFISADEGKVFLFDGNSLQPIMAGNEVWFSKYLPIKADADYKQSSGFDYPLANNPSNKFGTGFISVYDTTKERFIITKKDYVLSDRILNSTDYRICYSNGNIIIFDDYQQIIDDRASDNWDYDGLVDCKMKFSKTVYTEGSPEYLVEYETGLIVDEPIKYDLSWTMSYSLEDRQWISWHSYIPNFYFYRLQKFYSWKYGDNKIWKHNRVNHYQTFYGVHYPHIIEYVDNRAPEKTKIWDHISIQSTATVFDTTYEEDVDKEITFNKLIAYTSRQTTGELSLIPKLDDSNYLENQIVNKINEVPISRNEGTWRMNDLRDIVTNYSIPMFRKNIASLQSEYFIDKILNNDALDYEKDWYDLQSFRDKYLVVRLIFDNFDNIRLVTNFTDEKITPSER